MNENNIRQTIVETGHKLLANNLAEGRWGSISARLDDKYILVSPSGAGLSSLNPETLVVVDINTFEYEGGLKPTSEVKLHAAIYRTRSEVNAIVHSHPSSCSSVAVAGRDIPVISSEMQKIVGGAVRVADYALPNSQKLIDFVLRALMGRNACLMANHGMIACGENMDAAFDACQTMERSCQAFIENETLLLSEKDTFSQSDLFAIFKAGAQS